MNNNDARNKRFEFRKKMLKEKEYLDKTINNMSAGSATQKSAARLYGFFYAIEIIKVDKSAWSYKKLREILPFYLSSDETMPKELRELIIDELTRENPFYPDKGKHNSEVIMQRALEIGYQIEEKNEFSSIYSQIIPKIAKERNMTEAAVKKDYEQKYKKIFGVASENAMQSVRWHKAGLDEDAMFQKWLLENP